MNLHLYLYSDISSGPFRQSPAWKVWPLAWLLACLLKFFFARGRPTSSNTTVPINHPHQSTPLNPLFFRITYRCVLNNRHDGRCRAREEVLHGHAGKLPSFGQRCLVIAYAKSSITPVQMEACMQKNSFAQCSPLAFCHASYYVGILDSLRTSLRQS